MNVEVLADNIRVARKQHTCQLCRYLIEKGESYRDCRNAYDGRAYTWREHLRCGDFLKAVIDPLDYDDGYDWVLFTELVAEHRDVALSRHVPGAAAT